MSKLKTFHTLTGGQDSDTSSDYFQQDRTREVVNMELIQEQNAIRLQTIRSTEEMLLWIDLPATNLNVLAAVNVQAVYEAGVYGSDAVEHESIVVFSYDDDNGSVITLLDVETNSRYKLYPNADDSSPLNFPPNGTVSASFTKENGQPQIYWDDYKNELRKINLVIGNNVGNRANITNRSMSVRRRIGVIATTNHSLATGGSLASGSYQLFARLYNTITGDRSKWSLASNPIPICDPLGLSGAPIIGSQVGQIHDRKIVFRLDTLASEIQYYDSYQLAIVKSIDGLAIPSTVAYVTLPEKDNYDNIAAGTADVEYKGNTGIEKEVPLEQIVGEDAGIEYAKVQCIKDNRLWRGNIKYFDYKNDRGVANVGNAETIKEIVNYKDPLSTTNKKGHWRDEVYAYGLGYLDEFGNVGLVEPLDLAKFYKYERTGVNKLITAIVAQNAPYDQYTVSIDPTGINVWDYIEIGGVFCTVCEVGATTILVKGDLSAVSAPTVGYMLIGKAGNHTDNWAWKFPNRETPTFSLLDSLSNPLALGLRLTDITDYPSWAKAVIVVRQKRQKNILFQSFHLPTIGVLGVPTAGSEVRLDDPPTVQDVINNNFLKADYKQQYDTLMPKWIGIGSALNIGWDAAVYLGFLFMIPRYYRQYPITDPNYFPFREAPCYGIIYPPEWVYNFNGETVENANLAERAYLEIIDAVAFNKRTIYDTNGNFTLICDYISDTQSHYYNNVNGYYENTLGQRYYLTQPYTLLGIKQSFVSGEAKMVLNQQPFTITKQAFNEINYSTVKSFGYGEQLSFQQGSAEIVPLDAKRFFAPLPIQRSILLSTNDVIIDFTYYMWKGLFTNLENYFPFFPNPLDVNVQSEDIFQVQGMDIYTSNNTFITRPIVTNNKTVLLSNEVVGGSWIVNVVKGIDDDRYDKTSTNWVFTGAYAKLENNTNAPLSFDVWGGDCFVTIDAVKVNQNTNRTTNAFTSRGGVNDWGQDVKRVRKTGVFDDNVEFVQYWVESNVNTFFADKLDEYPYKESSLDNEGFYTKPYLKQYNGSFSIGNELKTYVSDEILSLDQRPQLYPARFVWSDVRIYQATDSAFFDTDGFSVFQPQSRQDLDEQYGGINALVDFADPTLHFIQDRKIRVEPVGRDFIERGDDGTQLILTDGTVIGRGGYYLPYQSGTQHMRSVQNYNGMCFYADVINRRIAMFGARGAGFKYISELGQISFFNNFLNEEISETALFGYIDSSNLKQHYVIMRNLKKCEGNAFAIRQNYWEAQIKSNEYHAALSIENVLYALDARLWQFYKGTGYGNLFGANVDSLFSIIASPANAAYTTVFDSIVLNKEGTITANLDECNVSWFDKVLNQQKSTDALQSTSYLYPTPIAPKNNRWWINRIRYDSERARATSYLVEFVLKNRERFGVYNVECNFTVSFRN